MKSLVVFLVCLSLVKNVYSSDVVLIPSFDNLSDSQFDVIVEKELIIQKAVKEWTIVHDCKYSTIFVHPFQSEIRNIDEKKYLSVGYGRSGNMHIDFSRENIREIVLHEMTHVCGGAIKMLEYPIPTYHEDINIVGFEGLSIIYRNTDGALTKDTLLEEAIAEYHAHFFDGYESMTYPYRALYQIMSDYEGGSLMSYVMNSDVVGLISKLLNRDEAESVQSIKSVIVGLNFLVRESD